VNDEQKSASATDDVTVPENLGEIEEIAPGSSEGETPAGEPDALARCQADLAETRDRLLRLAAEFENFKKRMERERDTLLKYAGENIFRELLNTVDNLARALEQGGSPQGDAGQRLESMMAGVGLTHKGLLAMLEKFGVTPVAGVGQPFDPNLHEALTTEASAEMPADHVLREFVTGYQYKERLLRAAKVVVSTAVPPPSA